MNFLNLCHVKAYDHGLSLPGMTLLLCSQSAWTNQVSHYSYGGIQSCLLVCYFNSWSYRGNTTTSVAMHTLKSGTLWGDFLPFHSFPNWLIVLFKIKVALRYSESVCNVCVSLQVPSRFLPTQSRVTSLDLSLHFYIIGSKQNRGLTKRFGFLRLIHPRQPNVPNCDGTIKVSQQPVTDPLRNVISVHLNPSSPLSVLISAEELSETDWSEL